MRPVYRADKPEEKFCAERLLAQLSSGLPFLNTPGLFQLMSSEQCEDVGELSFT